MFERATIENPEPDAGTPFDKAAEELEGKIEDISTRCEDKTMDPAERGKLLGQRARLLKEAEKSRQDAEAARQKEREEHAEISRMKATLRKEQECVCCSCARRRHPDPPVVKLAGTLGASAKRSSRRRQKQRG